jgi:hypothetical protein
VRRLFGGLCIAQRSSATHRWGARADFSRSIGTGGSATLAETLLNNANTTVGTINLVLFPPSPPNPTVSRHKPPGGVTNTSVLIDAFSLVPGPIVGAGLPGLVAACGGLLALARRRRRQCA